MSPSSHDRAIGMEVYCTKTAGIGGRIKLTPDSFIVEEIIDPTLDIATTADDAHGYPLYVLKKRNIDTTHALDEVYKAAGLRLKALGLKDARAVTKQYAGSTRKTRDVSPEIVTSHCALELVGYTSKPVTKKMLTANRFAIVIYGARSDAGDALNEIQTVARKNGLANFYGHQRFGSARAVTHLVGREILRRNFGRAVEIFLAYTAGTESDLQKEIRAKCIDPSNYASVLAVMPAKMDLERKLIAEMLKSNDAMKALRSLPLTIRRLFVQAYQSYLFNRSLSAAIKEGYDLATPERNDVCFSLAPDGRVAGMNRFDADAKKLQLPAMPMVGYAFNDSSRFGIIAKRIMEEEGIDRENFYVKEMQEVSAEGGFRQAALLCREFSYDVQDGVKIWFVLQKGSYATILLRELMKPSDPSAAGF